MNTFLKNTLAVVLGWVVGSMVNLGILKVGEWLMPIPHVESGDLEALRLAMPDLELPYFIFPFLAHALGTAVGAFVAAKIAGSYKMIMALIIGGIFMIGGLTMAMMVNSPWWYNVLDLVFAYFPMAYLGAKTAGVKGFNQ